MNEILSSMNAQKNSFMKHNLKGVLKCIGLEVCTQYPLTLPHTVTYTLAAPHHRP